MYVIKTNFKYHPVFIYFFFLTTLRFFFHWDFTRNAKYDFCWLIINERKKTFFATYTSCENFSFDDHQFLLRVQQVRYKQRFAGFGFPAIMGTKFFISKVYYHITYLGSLWSPIDCHMCHHVVKNSNIFSTQWTFLIGFPHCFSYSFS